MQFWRFVSTPILSIHVFCVHINTQCYASLLKSKPHYVQWSLLLGDSYMTTALDCNPMLYTTYIGDGPIEITGNLYLCSHS